MIPFLAETVASDINWTLLFTGAMSIGTVLMWWDARKAKSVRIDGQISGTPPDNSILARDLKSLGHRVKQLEDWRAQLIEKMDHDKTEILNAGDHRLQHLDSRINQLSTEISQMPSRIITDLANAKGFLK